MQNGHNLVIACFAILRADAVVVSIGSTKDLLGRGKARISNTDFRVCAGGAWFFASRRRGMPCSTVLDDASARERSGVERAQAPLCDYGVSHRAAA